MSVPADILVGRATRFARTLSQADVDRFGALSGDDHPIHVDPAAASFSGLPGTIVQGSLLVGLMAGASTRFFREVDRPALSYGYDRLRFTGTVPRGTPLTVDYRVTEHDRGTGKTLAEVRVTRADGTLVAVATHIAKLIAPAA